MSDLAEEIAQILAPAIGSGLALSVVSLQCKKMGILPDVLSEDYLEDFAERFRAPLELFAGEQVAGDLVEQIKSLH